MKAKGIQLILLLMILVSLPTAGYAQVRGGQKASTVNSGTSVTGVVYDVDGETLPGVSIRIPKRNIGVVSNVDGEFTIQAKEGEVLVVSYVGKKMKAEPFAKLWPPVSSTATRHLSQVRLHRSPPRT